MFCIFAYRKKWTEDHTETQGPKRTKSQKTLKRTSENHDKDSRDDSFTEYNIVIDIKFLHLKCF